MTTYKTPFSKRCEILSDLWMFHRFTENEGWADFFTWSDVGLPVAYAIHNGIVTIKKGQEQIIDEPWAILCEMIEVDPNKKYNSLTELFAASDHSALE